jgi:hypothetical protein
VARAKVALASAGLGLVEESASEEAMALVMQALVAKVGVVLGLGGLGSVMVPGWEARVWVVKLLVSGGLDSAMADAADVDRG